MATPSNPQEVGGKGLFFPSVQLASFPDREQHWLAGKALAATIQLQI